MALQNRASKFFDACTALGGYVTDGQVTHLGARIPTVSCYHSDLRYTDADVSSEKQIEKLIADYESKHNNTFPSDSYFNQYILPIIKQEDSQQNADRLCSQLSQSTAEKVNDSTDLNGDSRKYRVCQITLYTK